MCDQHFFALFRVPILMLVAEIYMLFPDTAKTCKCQAILVGHLSPEIQRTIVW